MIEIKTKIGHYKNQDRHYQWSCSICDKRGQWWNAVNLALESGITHLKIKHPDVQKEDK